MGKAIMNRIIKFFIRDLNGWKTILGYILLQIPWLTNHPLLLDAIRNWISEPANPQYIGELLLQVLLAIGVFHKLLKPKK